MGIEQLHFKEKDVFKFLLKFYGRHNYMPTYREIGEGLGMTRQYAYYILRKIRVKGYVTQGRKWRDIKLLT